MSTNAAPPSCGPRTRFLGRVPIICGRNDSTASLANRRKDGDTILKGVERQNGFLTSIHSKNENAQYKAVQKSNSLVRCSSTSGKQSASSSLVSNASSTVADSEADNDVIEQSIVASTSKKRITNSRAYYDHSSSCSRTLNSQEKLALKYWGLPELVLMRYRQKGIQTMFEWQAECLGMGRVLAGGNLIYSAPTSAGKTLVAEILLIKRVIEKKKKALVILPFVSLAREKMFALQNLLQDCHVRVGGFMGSQAPPGGLARTDVAVCTIEKANSIVNRLLEEGRKTQGCDLTDIGIVVVDELHMLGDPSRGYLLELLLTKIRFMSDRNNDCDIQIVGMSATLPNLSLLASWLDADLFKTDFRPVPLTELIKIGRHIYNNQFDFVKEIDPSANSIEGDSDNLVFLCLETVLGGHSVLVFCPTKNWCEKLADTVAKEFFKMGRPGATADFSVRQRLQAQLNGKDLAEVIDQLRRCPAGLEPSLSKAISFGVAFHHAGLTFDERDIVEGAFKRGVIRVLIATSTLSSGVNLPARRVIVRCPFTYQNQLIDSLSYKQMIGRAGRKGIDSEGESILICRENERSRIATLVSSELQPVSSCLLQGNGGSVGTAMKRAILEVIASGVAKTRAHVDKYASCTMLAHSIEAETEADAQDDCVRGCVKFLEENEFVRLQERVDDGDTSYIATQLGLACLASSLSPDEGLHVFQELQTARKCFVLENELHIVYQVVPIYAAVSWPNLDWIHYLSLWESLSPDMKRVGELVGVDERFIVRAMRGTLKKEKPKEMRALAIHQRFYTALALHDLVNEVSLQEVSKKYGASKGMLQSLQQAASTFAGMVTVFCHKLGWLNLELLLGQFQDRLQFGVQRELIDLCRLTTLNGQRARVLHTAGWDTVAALAHATHTQVENVLLNASPFESKKQGEAESNLEFNRRKESRFFWVTGSKGLTAAGAAKAIVEEARDILQKDLGVQINWSIQENAEMSMTTCLVSADHSRTNARKRKGGKSKKPACTRKRATSSRKKASTSTSKAPTPAPALNGSRKRSSSGSCAMQSKLVRASPVDAKSPYNNSLLRERSLVLAAPRNEMSFDMSGLVEGIFESEVAEAVELTEKPSVPSVHKSGAEREAKNPTSSPMPQQALNSKEGERLNFTNDIFGESIADISAIENMERAVAEGSPRNNIFSPVIAHNDTISDTFLERAMRTHMSADDFVEAEANGPRKSPEAKPCFAFAVPSSASPSSSSKCDTPTSRRLAQRRRARKATRISPGAFILSDSDSEAVADSPTAAAAAKARSQPASSTPRELQVIDVCSKRELFDAFAVEWRSQPTFAVALACARAKPNSGRDGARIGARITRSARLSSGPASGSLESTESLSLVVEDAGLVVVGMAVSWSMMCSFYIALATEDDFKGPDDSLSPASQDPSISLDEKVMLIQSVFETGDDRFVDMIDCKQHFKLLYLALDVVPNTDCVRMRDPRTAMWMLQPSDKEKNLSNMVMNVDPESAVLLETLGSAPGLGSVALNADGKSPARIRAVVEAILARRLMRRLKAGLEEAEMWSGFQEVEMQSVTSLARMELNGVGFSGEESERQKRMIVARMEDLEAEAYRIAGHHFSLTSPDDICQVLYKELRLPLNGDPGLSAKAATASVAAKNSRYKPSSSKDILVKLMAFHKLPKVIIEWKKLNMAISKVVFPMQRAKVHHRLLKMDRIYTSCQTHTATGRIALHEPNIQSIPRDFEIGGTNKTREIASGSKHMADMSQYSAILEESREETLTVSMRHAIVASGGFLVLAADYSQLELRILAHLSGDEKLCRILNDGSDVFKQIAATWRKKSVDQVTDEERQSAKQICYGMLYGMGSQALSEQLDVVESEAAVFLASFKDAYPGMTRFIEATVAECKKQGHVQTMFGRRRYLPQITAAANQFVRAAAERQAINTTVQGSAADLVKKAMNEIDRRLFEAFPQCRRPIKMSRRSRKQDSDVMKSGAYFILQMHDELLWEVSVNDVVQVAQIVKLSMESACQLKVKLPVKIKLGPSWGLLQDMKESA